MSSRPGEFDFDRIIDRAGTASLKHDGRAAQFGREDVLPLWVADMDFAAPEAVTRALLARAAHPIYGYTIYPDSLYTALIDWLHSRHGWQVQRDWVLMAPGVVPSLHAAALAFAGPGEGVIVQPPVYFPFFSAVTSTGRRLIENPLRRVGDRYCIDFDHLERCAADARILFLCSPHNPVGRVWEEDELRQVLAIARRHSLVVLADEIHHDLVYAGHRHRPLASLAEDGDQIVTAVAPSKTFNIPGLGLSALVVADPEARAALRTAFGLLHAGNNNPFSMVAFEAGYRGGEPWLNALLSYLQGNRDFVSAQIASRLGGIRVVPAEGTYLLWLDCSDLGMDDQALVNFFVHSAHVGMSPGRLFGQGGSGFMRMNIGAPRALIASALDRIESALGELAG